MLVKSICGVNLWRHTGMNSQLHESETDFGIVSSDAEIAAQGHAHTSPDSVPVDGCDCGNLQGADVQKVVVKFDHGCTIRVWAAARVPLPQPFYTGTAVSRRYLILSIEEREVLYLCPHRR